MTFGSSAVIASPLTFIPITYPEGNNLAVLLELLADQRLIDPSEFGLDN